MSKTQTIKLTGLLIGTYIAYKLALEVWCVIYGMIY